MCPFGIPNMYRDPTSIWISRKLDIGVVALTNRLAFPTEHGTNTQDFRRALAAKVMEIIWERGALSAKEISLIAADSIGWNKNTTYTVIKKLEAKGFIRRDEPGFICTPLVSREQMQKQETESLINKFFGGSKKALFSALIDKEDLTDEQAEELQRLIDKW